MISQSRIAALAGCIVLIFALPHVALAQQPSSTDSVPLGVNLDDPLCAIDLRLVSGSLGSWEWNGVEWVETSGGSGVRIVGLFTAVPFDGHCDVEFSFDGLGGSDGTIPSSSFGTTWYFPWGATGNPDEKKFPNLLVPGFVPFVYFDFDLVLFSIPATVPPGSYTGSLDVTVSNAA